MVGVYNRASMVLPAAMSGRVIHGAREGAMDIALVEEVSRWIRNVCRESLGDLPGDAAASNAGGHAAAGSEEHESGSSDGEEHSDHDREQPLIVTENRVHLQQPGSGEPGFPDGRTVCNKLLGSSIQNYQVHLHPAAVVGKRACAWCFGHAGTA